MKLNNGKGWEVLKSHPSAVQDMRNTNPPHHASMVPNIHGQQGRHKTPIPIDPNRLDQALPNPAAARGAAGRNSRDPNRSSGVKRMGEMAPQEAASTQAQFQHSQPNLGSNRALPTASPQVQQQQQQQQRRPEPEKPSFMQKLSSILCCGGGK